MGHSSRSPSQEGLMGTVWSQERYSPTDKKRKSSTWPSRLQPSDAGGWGTCERLPSNRPTKTRWLNFAWTIDKKRFFFQSEIQLDPLHPFSQQPGTGAPWWRITILFVFFCIVVLRCGPTAEKTSRTCVSPCCSCILQLGRDGAQQNNQMKQTTKTVLSVFCHKYSFSRFTFIWFSLGPQWDVGFLCAQASGQSTSHYRVFYLFIFFNQFGITATDFKQILFLRPSFKWSQKSFI